jgi:hypothetical protein
VEGFIYANAKQTDKSVRTSPSKRKAISKTDEIVFFCEMAQGKMLLGEQ